MYPDIIDRAFEIAFMTQITLMKQQRAAQDAFRLRVESDAVDQKRRFYAEMEKARQRRAAWDIDC